MGDSGVKERVDSVRQSAQTDAAAPDPHGVCHGLREPRADRFPLNRGVSVRPRGVCGHVANKRGVNGNEPQQKGGSAMGRNRCERVLSLLVAVCLVSASPALAQTQTGNISGTVADPQGAALPGVIVTVFGVSVMGTKTATTGTAGSFRFPSLLPAEDYRVQFALAGFATVNRENIRVSVGQTTTLLVTMAPATVKAEMTVVGNTPMVDSTSAASSSHFDPKLFDNLPNRRDFADVLVYTPGIVAEADNTMFASVRGGSVLANETAIDGVANTDPVFHTSRQPLINESVAEIQVITGGLPAEVGNVGGAYINVVTKSGGNEFSGQLGAYFNSESWQGNNLNDELKDQGVTETPTITSSNDYSFNLGGPIARDKLWFNVGYWMNDQTTSVNGFPPGYVNDNDTYFGKLTWQPSPSHNLFAMYNYTDQRVPYWHAGPLVAVEGNWNATVIHQLGKAQWTAVFSPNVFSEIAVARSRITDHQRPQTGAWAPYLELTSGYTWGSAWFYQDDVQSRDQAKASLSFFKDDWAGSHAFKLGVEYEDSGFEIREYTLQPIWLHLLWAGYPILVWVANDPIESLTKVSGLNGYVQDTWMVTSGITLNLGLRMNNWEAIYPAQSHDEFSYGANVYFPALQTPRKTVVDWQTFDPRLAATFALDDQGKSQLRFSFSRYHEQMAITYLMQGNPNFRSLQLHTWTDTNGNLYGDADELGPAISYAGGNENVDPDLKQPYADEIMIGFEKELFSNFALTVNATWREEKDLIEDVDGSIDDPSAWSPMEVPDPGPDQLFGTADDKTLTVYNRVTSNPVALTITNPKGLERKYKGVELIANKRLSNNWQGFGSIVWGRATGNLRTSWGSGGEALGWSTSLVDKNSFINRGGATSLDREWQFKVGGTYFAPLGFSFGGFYQYATGLPLYRTYTVAVTQGTTTVFADDWDTWRGDHFSRLDLRAEKAFTFGSHMSLGLILDVFNVFNENSATSKNGFTGSYNPADQSFVAGQGEFQRAMAVQPPRLFRLGVRFTF